MPINWSTICQAPGPQRANQLVCNVPTIWFTTCQSSGPQHANQVVPNMPINTINRPNIQFFRFAFRRHQQVVHQVLKSPKKNLSPKKENNTRSLPETEPGFFGDFPKEDSAYWTTDGPKWVSNLLKFVQIFPLATQNPRAPLSRRKYIEIDKKM